MGILSRLLGRARSEAGFRNSRSPLDFRYRSALDLPEVGRADLPETPEASAYFPEGRNIRTFHRMAPAFLDDPDDVGHFRTLKGGTYTSPPCSVTSIPGADLIGYRTVLAGDRFLTDEVPISEPARDHALSLLASEDPFLNEETGLRPAGENTRFRLDEGGRATRRLDGPHIFLGSHEPANYGSFLFRVVPKLTLLDIPSLADLPIIVQARSQSAKRLLELLGIERSRLIDHEPTMRTSVDRLIVPGLRNPHAYLDGASRALYLDLAESIASARHDRKIYVSRRGHAAVGGSTRVMMNEDQIIERMFSLGLEIVEPEKLSMDEQIKTFAEARLVVGPSGSGMFNVMFCRPGTVVIDIESEPNWIYAHSGLFASCGLDYGLFVGKPDATDERPVHRRWTVDIEALTRRVSQNL